MGFEGPEHAGAFGEMVLAQGLGDEDCQASRDEQAIHELAGRLPHLSVQEQSCSGRRCDDGI
jgi:hypothetical protein